MTHILYLSFATFLSLAFIFDTNMKSENSNQAKIGLESALLKLEDSGKPYLEYFENGSMRVGMYGPKEVDRQQPHDQDELYVIAEGSGSFIADGVKHEFEKGDVLFVAAGVEHRFLEFSSNFRTWVFFYGPEGGE